MKVVHLSSVHARYDNRILMKECASLAKSGFNTFLIVADGLGDETYNGVIILDVGAKKNIIHRMLLVVPKIAWKSLKLKSHVYHFHDPELIPLGLLFTFLQKKVIYDIHEDYITSIRQKKYLPKVIAQCIAFLFGFFEKFSAKFFTNIIAEKYYAKRFPESTPILNYPIFEEHKVNDRSANNDIVEPISKDNEIKLIYTGNITVDRGALQHAKIASYINEAEVVMVGKCSPQLAKQMVETAELGKERLTVEGVGTFVTPLRIAEYYTQHEWTAGLALFPKTRHYEKKELTKFFEYMKFGLPIICTDFPSWKALIEENGCGFAVDPENADEIRHAIFTLAQSPGLRQQMGRRGQQLVRNTFNWQQEEERLIKLYHELLEVT